jgi:uncharacterized protein YndB with AHSA1/START domain
VPRTDTASRPISAPPEHIYSALVDPDALTAWLPPAGMTGRFEHFEARAGGTYRLVLTYPDGSTSPGKSSENTDIVQARFVELTPGVRVTQAVDFVSEDSSFSGTMTMTWAISPTNGGSLVTITAEDVPEGISREDHAAGLSSSLQNLAAYVER